MTNSLVEQVKSVRATAAPTQEIGVFTQAITGLVGRCIEESKTPWLNELRQEALNQISRASWPSRKTESWKYTSLVALAAQAFSGQVEENLVDATSIALDDSGSVLVFVDGVYSAELSKLGVAPSLICQRFSEADPECQVLIKEHLGTIADAGKHLFVTHNNALVEDGVFLKLGKNVKVEPAVSVIHLSTRQVNPCLTAARVLVVLEEGAELTLIERFSSSNEEQNGFCNSLTECVVGANAQLNHYRILLEPESAKHIGGLHVNLLANSRINSFHLGLGCALRRTDIVVNHCEAGAHCELKGVYLAKHEQHIDFHTDIQHKSAHCTTDEVFRGIIDDRAQATFNGRIYIHPHAQKTVAQLSNKNLLLSDQAEINTKPELEIYADDVKCAHGATISQLDEGALSYLRSRAIDRAQAELMMSYGFINELIEEVSVEPLRETLKVVINAWFGREK